MLSLRPQHLKRYKDIAWLLVKYGRSDIVRQSGLHRALPAASRAAAEIDGKAEELVDDLERMGPTFIKLGQLLSTRPDILPRPYLDALVRLQDHVEPFPFDQVEQIVCSELGVRLSRAFTEFEPKPAASASLAQVHRARLPSGRPVAVKVQRPAVRDIVFEDLDVLDELAEFMDQHTDAGRRYEFRRLVAALRRTLLAELDYRNEAQNFQLLRRNMKSFRRILVPRAIDDYTTSRVLTMDYVRGRKITELGPLALMEIDGAALADELFRAYLRQALVNGFFHADPHPGNLLLTDDLRIALLDLGMTCRVPSRLQEHFVRLLLTISEGQGEEAAEATIRMGQPKEDFDKAEFQREITRLVTDTRDASITQIEPGRVVLEIQRAASQYGIRLPDEFTMLGKVFMNLDATLTALDPEFHINEAMRRRSSEILRQHTGEHLSPGRLYESLLEINELVQMFPQRFNRVMELLSQNELRLHIDAIDEKELIRGIQKIANRVAGGLVLAALIVGASIMMHVETSFTVLGYPAIAMVFFLIAAVGGMVLVYKTLFQDRR